MAYTKLSIGFVLLHVDTEGYSISTGSAPLPNTINVPLAEILVGVDSSGFYARWMKTGQKIIARLNSMLNPMSMPTPIRFLFDIANQGVSSLAPFSWGSAERLPVLPRLEVEKIVLSPAMWKLKYLAEKYNDGIGNAELFAQALSDWRAAFDVPRQVQFASRGVWDDNLFFLDLESSDDIAQLQSLLGESGGHSSIIREYIPVDTWHSTEEGHYATEIVATFIRADFNQNQTSPGVPTPTFARFSPADYLRPPGSDWLYLRLDCARAIQEEVITSLGRLTDQLMAVGSIRGCFFIRYIDFNHHLRIRFKTCKEQLYERLMPEVSRWASNLIHSGLCHDFSFRTYDREVERYGGIEGVTLAEELFCEDSVQVIKLLELAAQKRLDRITVGVLSINALLAAFIPDAQTRLDFLKAGVSAGTRKEVSKDYRRLKSFFGALLARDLSAPETQVYEEIISQIDSTCIKIREIAARLDLAHQEGFLFATPNDLVQSFVHMHCNRFYENALDAERQTRTLLFNCLETAIKRRANLSRVEKVGSSSVSTISMRSA
jgi:thiopeptide-type bacteriocin biosynthesis protein